MVTLENLIEALRNELKQYGEMLALLEHQQELASQQRSDDILHSISAIDTQSAAIQAARANRQLAQRSLGQCFGEIQEVTFAALIPRLPEPYRPLVTALVQENNELLLRVRQRAQQNHVFLRQSLEKMQRFITTLPSHETTVLTRCDHGQPTGIAREPLQYEAIV